jgi:hypothetical protein
VVVVGAVVGEGAVQVTRAAVRAALDALAVSPAESGIMWSAFGRLAQLVRAFGSHPRGHRFEPCVAHQITALEPARNVTLAWSRATNSPAC